MSERSDGILVDDMIEAIERILSYTEGMSFEQFSEDTKTSDAVLRNLQVLGEAANKVSALAKGMDKDIEWVKVVRSRNIVVHEYFGVDFEIIWRIISVHLPPLREQLDILSRKLSS